MPIRIVGDKPRTCPFPCGICCHTLWHTIPSLAENGLDKEKPCPHLGLEGCMLLPEKMPPECQRYLCDIAEGFVEGRISKGRALMLHGMRKLAFENKRKLSETQ